MTSLSIFRGADVLTIVPPRLFGRDEPWARATDVAENPAGAFYLATAGDYPDVAHALRFVTQTRAEYAALGSFLAEREGRYVPFWLPSWQRDFTVLSTGFYTLTVRSWGYAQSLFPKAAHRYLWVAERGGLLQAAHRISNAVDNGDGTETITLNGLDATTGDANYATGTAGGAAYCLLRFARLADDRVTERWLTPELCEVMLRLAELPEEAP